MSAPTNMKTFVVIPAYNESKVIKETVSRLKAVCDCSVVVVDDCSVDSTEQICMNLPVDYVRHPVNLGQGAALQTGMDHALQCGADVIVHFDADGQHDPREIKHFVERIASGEYDAVLGSRFLRPEDIAAVPPMRRLLLQAARIVNVCVSGLWLTDAHNGFRAFSRAGASRIQITQNRMAHATEILSEIRRERLRYVEIPVHVQYTDYSITKGQRANGAVKVVLELFEGIFSK